jgi:precorrin-3B C17-methyltransferase
VDVLIRRLPGDTPCGWVRNAARAGRTQRLLTLAQLRDERVDMFTTVIVGNRSTVRAGDRLITPRGYRK